MTGNNERNGVSMKIEEVKRQYERGDLTSQGAVWEMIRRNPRITQSEMAQVMGISCAATWLAVSKLIKAGRLKANIIVHETGRQNVYEIID